MPAQTLHALFLQHAQQFGLQAQGQLADLVQQQGAAIGHFKLAALGRHRAGKGAALMTEQQGFEHLLGDGRAIDGHKRGIVAGGKTVNVARHHLFAGAGFTGNQDRRTGHGHPLGHRQQTAPRCRTRHKAFLGTGRRRMPLQQRLDLDGTERRQQVVHAPSFKQRRCTFLLGVLDNRNNTYMAGVTNKVFSLGI